MATSRTDPETATFPLLNTNNTLHQWSQTLRKKNPDVKDILVAMPLEGRNLSVDYAELHYNNMFKSHNITSSIDGFHFNHQLLASRYMIFNDILLLMHEPGTGKTRTQLYAMMNALTASLIKKILIINRSSPANEVAIQTLKVLYAHEFEPHFEMPFGKFVQQYVSTRTIKKLNDYSTDDYTGIIIDEAHGVNTEDKSAKTDKSKKLKAFIGTLAQKRGIKMILSTATPIFGNVDVVEDYMKLLFRTQNPKADYGITDFQSSMVSYTMINYDHIKIKQIMNPEDTSIEIARQDEIESSVRRVNGVEPKRARGDQSFMLDDGYGEYTLHLYMSKPAPMQIADLAKISMMKKPEKRVVFYSDSKPIMVRSSRASTQEKYQSAILDEIVRRGNETNYGIIVIYCDIKKDGANNVAEYFREKHGITAFSGNEDTQGGNKGYNVPAEVGKIDAFITDRRVEIRNLYKQIPRITKREILEMGSVLDQYEESQNGYANGTTEPTNQNYIHLSDLPFSESVIRKMRERYDILKLNAVREDKIMAEIQAHEEEIELLENRRSFIMKDFEDEQNCQNKKHRYFIYEPSMNTANKLIFEKVNSPENWNGGMVKYVIGSRVMRDGTDIKHGIQIHIIIPEWRIPGLVQAQHRIIRSNGHNEIIRQLALELVRKHAINKNLKNLTRSEAQAIVRKKGIPVEIYNHLLDVDSVTVDDVTKSIKYLSPEFKFVLQQKCRSENKQFPAGILQSMVDAIQSREGARGGMKLYDAAIGHHRSVGKKQIQMRSSAVDYMLNVRKDLRNKLRDQLNPEIRGRDPVETGRLSGLGATEMFFADYHIKRITEDVKALLLEENAINTDQIVEHLIRENDMYSEQIIATSIKLLVDRDKYIYNDSLGINMIIQLYVTEHESILYLSTTEDPNATSHANHPYNKRVNALRVSLIEEFRREPTTIDESDLTLPKRAEAFYKLYDLIERATKPGYQLNEPEYEFLVQMSEWWMVLEKDITDPSVKIQDMMFYVIEKHIERPSIDILSKNLLVHEFDPHPKVRRWKVKYTLSVRDQRFVRFVQLAQNYAAYDPTGDSARSNGLILTKSIYSEPHGTNSKYATDAPENSLTYRLLEPECALMEPYETKVIIKEANVMNTRGYQLRQNQNNAKITRAQIVNLIYSRAREDMYLLFFVYNSVNNTRVKNTRFRNYVHTLKTIKEHEHHVIEQAKAGTPTSMFQIEYVELHYHGSAKVAKYKEIYMDRA